MNKGNILFLDDDQPFLDTRAIFIERAGYTVFKAYEIQEAEEILANRWIQLIISDVRLKDRDDPTDIEGILFSERAEYQKIPKIIVTAFPNRDDTRRVLRTYHNGKSIAIDYLDKETEPEEMIKVIDDIFEHHIQLNTALKIIWQRINLIELLGIIHPDGQRANFSERIGELQGLFQTLFRDYQTITIEQILTGNKHAPRLLVDAQNEDGHSQRFMIQVGQAEIVTQEHTQFNHAVHINRFNMLSRMTEAVLFEATPRFAAIAWVFRGFGSNLSLFTFKEMLERFTNLHLHTSLTLFFQNVLFPWHGYLGEVRPIDFRKHFQITENTQLLSNLSQLQETVGHYSREIGLGDLHHNSEKFSFIPTYLHSGADHILMSSLTKIVSALLDMKNVQVLKIGVVHGGLNINNLFFNAQGEGWLIDFLGSQTQAPLLIDYFIFERNLRLDWSAIINTFEWYQIESDILYPDDIENNPLTKGLWLKQCTLLNHIRKYGAVESEIEVSDYLSGFFWSNIAYLNALTEDDYQTSRDLQATINLIISTIMIGEYILARLHPKSGGLKIDYERHEALINDEPVHLSPLEYDLLCYLFDHKNKTVSRLDIAQSVLGADLGKTDELSAEMIEYDRVNMTIKRLRQKLEQASGKTDYITTVRGKGYRLDIKEIE